MILRTLGQSDLRITPIGIGAGSIGGGKWESDGVRRMTRNPSPRSAQGWIKA